MLGARMSCGRGDWRRFGRRSWRILRAVGEDGQLVFLARREVLVFCLLTLSKLGFVGVWRLLLPDADPEDAGGVEEGL